MTDIQLRFKEFCEYLKKTEKATQTQIAEWMGGYDQTMVSSIVTGKLKDNKPIEPSMKALKALEKSKNLNIQWLLHGEGEMLIPSEEKVKGFELRTDRKLPDQSIPLYDIEASAGLLNIFTGKENSIIDYIHIPNMPRVDGAVYLTGDSMYPLLKSGDIVAYKVIKDIVNGIIWGEVYLVSFRIDDDYLTVAKYIQKSELGSDHIKLVSYNEHHAPKDIPINSIRALALIKASVRLHTMS